MKLNSEKEETETELPAEKEERRRRRRKRLPGGNFQPLPAIEWKQMKSPSTAN